MQTKVNKYIVLIILLLVSVALSAQVGRRKYVTRTGDTTVVVMTGSTGLYGEDAKFLLDQRATEDFLEKRSRYSRLRDAVIETQEVADIVEEEHTGNNPVAGSLAFRTAQQNIRYLENEKKANTGVNTGINTRASAAELAYIKEKFGHMPSFFVNGVPVESDVALRIPRNAVLSREVKVTNTTTGNPNGEIWMLVTAKAFDRLDLGVSYAENDNSNEVAEPNFQASVDDAPIQIANENDKYRGLTPEQVSRRRQEEAEIEELRRVIQSFGAKPVESVKPLERPKENVERREITQKVGNRFVDPQEEIVSFRDSPQERSRRARDKGLESKVAKSQNEREEVIQVTNQAEQESFSDPEITDQTPKRSVRRIKERQRNQ